MSPSLRQDRSMQYPGNVEHTLDNLQRATRESVRSLIETLGLTGARPWTAALVLRRLVLEDQYLGEKRRAELVADLGAYYDSCAAAAGVHVEAIREADSIAWHAVDQYLIDLEDADEAAVELVTEELRLKLLALLESGQARQVARSVGIHRALDSLRDRYLETRNEAVNAAYDADLTPADIKTAHAAAIKVAGERAEPPVRFPAIPAELVEKRGAA